MSTPVLRSPIAPHARALARLHSPRTAHRPRRAGPRRRPGAAIVVVTRAAAASKGADTTGASGKKGKTNVTDMYVALREMRRAAEEAETECVLNASNSSEQSKCTEQYLEAAEEIEAASSRRWRREPARRRSASSPRRPSRRRAPIASASSPPPRRMSSTA